MFEVTLTKMVSIPQRNTQWPMGYLSIQMAILLDKNILLISGEYPKTLRASFSMVLAVLDIVDT
jgi:hypothetical protein